MCNGLLFSPAHDTESCLIALEMAIKTGYKPKMINSDQGCQFTSQEWTYQLTLLKVQISMDGKGRWLDNLPIERFWRTIKYEEVYLKTYETVQEARQEIEAYIHWYNHERRHTGIDKHRPFEIMIGDRQVNNKGVAKTKENGNKADSLDPLNLVTKPKTLKQHQTKLTNKLPSKIAA